LREAGHADLLRIQLRATLGEKVAIACDEEVACTALQAHSIGIEHLTVGYCQVAGGGILAERVAGGALGARSCCEIVGRAVDHKQNAEIVAQLVALAAGEAGTRRRGRGAVRRE